MRVATAGVLILTLAASSGVAAQTLSLTESQALALLSEETAQVRSIRAAVDLARADVLAAARWPNPRVTFDRESVAGVTEHIATIGQRIPLSGARGLDVAAATARVSASASRAEDRIRRVRADLRIAFAELVGAQRREQELARSRNELMTLAEALQRREEEGDAAGVDLLRAEREVLELEMESVAAAVDRTRAQTVLAAFFVRPASVTDLVAVQQDVATRPLPPLDELVARAASGRGDLIALQREAESARLSERAARRRLLPEPEVVAGTKSSNAAGGDVGAVVAVNVTLPLFDRSRAERAYARAQAASAEAQADVVERTLGAEVAALREEVVARRSAADRYRAALDDASRIGRIALVSYEAGEHGILDLLAAYRNASAARIRQAALDLAVRRAEIELEFASGWEIP